MKEKWNKLVEKAKENKGMILRVAGAVAVAAIGAAAVGLAIHLKNERDNQALFEEAEFTDLESETEESETDE